MAVHASTRTTQLYDRREDQVTLDEVRSIFGGSSSQRQHEPFANMTDWLAATAGQAVKKAIDARAQVAA